VTPHAVFPRARRSKAHWRSALKLGKKKKKKKRKQKDISNDSSAETASANTEVPNEKKLKPPQPP